MRHHAPVHVVPPGLPPLLTVSCSLRSADSPLLWIRIDPDMSILRKVEFEQADFMWQYQLRYERDVVAQVGRCKESWAGWARCYLDLISLLRFSIYNLTQLFEGGVSCLLDASCWMRNGNGPSLVLSRCNFMPTCSS